MKNYTKELQLMMHDLGLDAFKEQLTQAAYDASQELEDISTKKSEAYHAFAQLVAGPNDDNE